MEIEQYVRIVARRKWIIIAVAAVAGIAALVASMGEPPAYEATAIMAIPTEVGAAEMIQGLGRLSADASAEMAQLQLLRLRSRLLARRVQQDMNAAIPPEELMEMVDAQVDPNVPSAFTITIVDSEPHRAARMANAYARTLLSVDASQASGEVKAALEKLNAKIRAYDEEINQLSKRMDAARGRSQGSRAIVGGAPPASAAAKTELYAQWQKATNARDALAQRRDELSLLETAQGPIQIIEYAVPPDEPLGPGPVSMGVLGVLGGLVLGVSGAFVLEYVDGTLKTKAEIERELDSPVVGEVPKPTGGDSRDALSVELTTPTAEAYGLLRTNIVFISKQHAARTLLLTEVPTGIGGASVVANLATSFAQAGYRVAIICCNLRHPGVTEYFDLRGEGQGGLSDWLPKGGRVEAFMYDTQIDGVRIMPPGTPVGNPTELLGSHSMEQLPAGLAQTYDIVLLEGPPVLETADASILAQRVDGVLVVTGLGIAGPEVAQQARKRLDAVKARIVGVVVVG